MPNSRGRDSVKVSTADSTLGPEASSVAPDAMVTAPSPEDRADSLRPTPSPVSHPRTMRIGTGSEGALDAAARYAVLGRVSGKPQQGRQLRHPTCLDDRTQSGARQRE